MHTIRLIPGGDAFCLSFSSLFSCFAHDGQTTAISQQSGRFSMRFSVTQMGTAAQKVKPSAFFISVRRRFKRETLRCSSCAISRIFFPASTSAKPINSRNLNRVHDCILKRAGISHIGIHALRHTFASQLFANRVDIKVIFKLTAGPFGRIGYIQHLYSSYAKRIA